MFSNCALMPDVCADEMKRVDGLMGICAFVGECRADSADSKRSKRQLYLSIDTGTAGGCNMWLGLRGSIQSNSLATSIVVDLCTW